MTTYDTVGVIPLCLRNAYLFGIQRSTVKALCYFLFRYAFLYSVHTKSNFNFDVFSNVCKEHGPYYCTVLQNVQIYEKTAHLDM